MVQSKRGRGRGRAGLGPRVLPPIGQHLESEAACWTLRDEREVESDDSTQPPDVVCETFFETTSAEVNTVSEVPSIRKHGRGVAKGTEFERLRKYGKIPLEIKDGKIGPSCNNTTVYTTRVTWIVKHYAEMRHVSWSVVDVKDKDELIDRVRADFVFDWTKQNHRRTVTTQLSRAYNAFHYTLHRKYLSYETHEEAVVNGRSWVEQPVWEWLCRRWKMSSQNKENRHKQKVNHTSGRTSFVVLMERKKDRNLIDFYKDAHWSIKKGRFITPTTEENYNKMVSMMNAKEVECRTDEAAAVIFREVLGHRSGYSRGLGHSVLPEKSTENGVPNEEYERLAEENQQNRKNAEYYQNRVIEIEGGFAAMRNHMEEYEQRVNIRMSELETELESQRETLNANP
ncbi:hypothetical protein F2P56_022022 [Juglans regia]|uniref:Uncharacterized protein n=1 Tax=Juglans regia TaxID=51240 RepID=A0A833TE72_JUGRE|nr:hypothetical protein F2P56_022022 [Juglans regia]